MGLIFEHDMSGMWFLEVVAMVDGAVSSMFVSRSHE